MASCYISCACPSGGPGNSAGRVAQQMGASVLKQVLAKRPSIKEGMHKSDALYDASEVRLVASK